MKLRDCIVFSNISTKKRHTYRILETNTKRKEKERKKIKNTINENKEKLLLHFFN